MLALAITPIQLLRKRGDRLHRRFGSIWAVVLFGTAVITFGIRDINDGHFSFIHLFSVLTIVMVPLLVWAAHSQKIVQHRSTVRGLTTGALLAAGYFTFLPQRRLGGWLFG